jgi:hypothetical protein
MHTFTRTLREADCPVDAVQVSLHSDFFAADDALITAALGFIAANSHLQIGKTTSPAQ